MSADLPSPPNGPEQPSSNGAEGEATEFPRQKRRSRLDDDEQEETQDQQIAVLTSLLANLMRNKGPSEPPPPKKVYWFNKGKAAPHIGRAVAPGAPGPGLPDAPAKAAAPAVAVPAAPASGERDYTRYSDEILEPPGSQEDVPAAAVLPIGLEPPGPPEAPPLANTAAPGPGAPVDPETVLASQDPSFWRAPQESAPVPTLPGWGYWVLTILVGVAAFLAGTRMTDSTQTVSPVAAYQNSLQAWSDVSLARLDGILKADQAGDLDNAYQMARALQTEAGPLPGLEIYLNLLDARGRKLADAQAHFVKMVISSVNGPQLALIESALAFTYARQRRFSDASAELEKAVAADPFTAESFRLLGESLRREGHFPQAVTAFRQALLRYPAGATELLDLREYIKYTLRLAEIEGNLPVENRPAGTESGATADSAGYWFLSDAAAALQQGKGDIAVEALQQAKAALPATLFQSLLGDYFFRAYLGVPQVAAFFRADLDPAGRDLNSQPAYFVDP
jgi:tetratricopeptide (TPR) repeat protein